jgi:hypothetical protein
MRSLPFAADFQLHELDAVELALHRVTFRPGAATAKPPPAMTGRKHQQRR